MAFPEFRARRLRDHVVFREMVAEASLEPRRLVQPLFVKEGLKGRNSISSLPGQAQLGPKELLAEARYLTFIPRITGNDIFLYIGKEA